MLSSSLSQNLSIPFTPVSVYLSSLYTLCLCVIETNFNFDLIKTYYIDWLLFKFGRQILIKIPQSVLSMFSDVSFIVWISHASAENNWTSNELTKINCLQCIEKRGRIGVFIVVVLDGKMSDSVCLHESSVLNNRGKERHEKNAENVFMYAMWCCHHRFHLYLCIIIDQNEITYKHVINCSEMIRCSIQIYLLRILWCSPI